MLHPTTKPHSLPPSFSSPPAAIGLLLLLAPLAPAQTLQNLGSLPGATSPRPTAISGDGTVVVGHAETPAGQRAFRWTAATGMEELPMLPAWPSARAGAVSHDGMIAVGYSGDILSPRAVRWRSTPAGIIADELGAFPGGTYSIATGVSADGSIIVGWSESGGAFRWTEATGMVPLHPEFAYATAVSADGGTIVGASGLCALFWTSTTGMVQLFPCGPNNEHIASAVSADGKVAVGYTEGSIAPIGAPRWELHPSPTAASYLLSPNPPGHAAAYAANADGSLIVGSGYSTTGGEAIIWHQSLGAFCIQSHLAVGVGWRLRVATGISADGQTITGWGTHNDIEQAWIATFPVRTFCYANCDNSTTLPILTIDDFTCFINEFAHATTLPHEQQVVHYANCDDGPPPVLSIDDFICFINAFAAGCP